MPLPKRTAPVPPPVYRPTGPLQTKLAKGALPAVPPVFRPGAQAQAIQPKPAFGPPVYRPYAKPSQANMPPARPVSLPLPARPRAIQRALAVAAAAPVAALSITGLSTTVIVNGIGLTGTLSDGRAITGSVYTPIYYIDVSGNAAKQPIAEAASDFIDRARWHKAMRVHNIGAKPEGLALGNFLAYHVGKRARAAGIEYVLAMHVVPKARNFYTRLGFQEYDVANTYPQQLIDKAAVTAALGVAAPGPAFDDLFRRQEALNLRMVDATMFIRVDTLIANAWLYWARSWQANPDGSYTRK